MGNVAGLHGRAANDLQSGNDLVGIMKLKGFFDASGGHGGVDHKGHEAPTAIVAGYFASGFRWQEFEKKWAEFLKKHHISHLHATHLYAGKNEYAGWTETQKMNAIHDAITLIENHVLFGMVRMLDIADYNQFITEVPESVAEFKSPYHTCAVFTCWGGRTYADRLKYTDSISYVFEKGDPHQAELLAAHTEIARNKVMAPLFRFREGGIAFEDKKDWGGLQAADLLANLYYKESYRKKYEGSIEPFTRNELMRLDRIPGDYATYDAKSLRIIWDDFDPSAGVNAEEEND